MQLKTKTVLVQEINITHVYMMRQDVKTTEPL